MSSGSNSSQNSAAGVRRPFSEISDSVIAEDSTATSGRERRRRRIPRNESVWTDVYPVHYSYGQRIATDHVESTANYMGMSLKGNGKMETQRLSFPVGKPKDTPLSEFPDAAGKAFVFRLDFTTLHNRKINFESERDRDTFHKKNASIVSVAVRTNDELFPRTRGDSTYRLDGDIWLNVNVNLATSETASNTREGVSYFVIPGLADDHPCKNKEFQCTIVQQSHVRSPQGKWCWGPDTSIRSITLEPRSDALSIPKVSSALLEGLRIADNPVSEEQQTDEVRREEEKIERDIAEQEAADQAMDCGDSSVPTTDRQTFSEQELDEMIDFIATSSLDLEPRQLDPSNSGTPPTTSFWAHGLNVMVRAVFVDGCVCGDQPTCMFCRGEIPGYQRLWSEQIEGGDGLGEEQVGVVPEYDESGHAAADTILQDRHNRLTEDGQQWLQQQADTSNPPPRFRTMTDLVSQLTERFERILWLLPSWTSTPVDTVRSNMETLIHRSSTGLLEVSLYHDRSVLERSHAMCTETSEQLNTLEVIAAMQITQKVDQMLEDSDLQVANTRKLGRIFGSSSQIDVICEISSRITTHFETLMLSISLYDESDAVDFFLNKVLDDFETLMTDYLEYSGLVTGLLLERLGEAMHTYSVRTPSTSMAIRDRLQDALECIEARYGNGDRDNLPEIRDLRRHMQFWTSTYPLALLGPSDDEDIPLFYNPIEMLGFQPETAITIDVVAKMLKIMRDGLEPADSFGPGPAPSSEATIATIRARESVLYEKLVQYGVGSRPISMLYELLQRIGDAARVEANAAYYEQHPEAVDDRVRACQALPGQIMGLNDTASSLQSDASSSSSGGGGSGGNNGWYFPGGFL